MLKPSEKMNLNECLLLNAMKIEPLNRMMNIILHLPVIKQIFILITDYNSIPISWERTLLLNNIAVDIMEDEERRQFIRETGRKNWEERWDKLQKSHKEFVRSIIENDNYNQNNPGEKE